MLLLLFPLLLLRWTDQGALRRHYLGLDVEGYPPSSLSQDRLVRLGAGGQGLRGGKRGGRVR